MGKQHVGYARLRAGVDTILEERRKRREDRDKEKVGGQTLFVQPRTSLSDLYSLHPEGKNLDLDPEDT